MTDKALLNFITAFVKGMRGNRTSKDMCYVVSLPLYSYMEFCDIECELTEGELHIAGNIRHHYWITLKDGRIIDATADQFKHPDGSEMPRIYFGVKPDWYSPLK